MPTAPELSPAERVAWLLWQAEGDLLHPSLPPTRDMRRWLAHGDEYRAVKIAAAQLLDAGVIVAP